MPISNYNGKAFVAFVDISGFKKMMFNDKNKAFEALDTFYQIGYNALKRDNINKCIQGLFISDCGILIAKFDKKEKYCNNKKVEKLNALLNVIKEINYKMLESNFMLTTSIAFGDFKYKNKIELKNISKNWLVGNAYLDAFLDNEDKTYKLKPGQCRIICSTNDLENLCFNDLGDNFIIGEEVNNKRHRYFYWNLQDKNQIKSFEQIYKKADNKVYEAELNALKKFAKEN